MASVLSTGQRKRLELARAIASGGRLLLLDEVTQGVDAATLECLVELIERLRRESGCSVLIVDHDMAVLKRLCDRLVALDLGIVIAEGAPDQVLAHADVVASYVSA